MLFNSIEYLIFFPIIAIIYFVLPLKLRTFWLMCASFTFYAFWNKKYLLLLLACIGVTYLAGLVLDRFRDKKIGVKKLVLFAGVAIQLGVLFYFKYFSFFWETAQDLWGWPKSDIDDILLPVGISFFTFQAIGYVIDVYRGTIRAEKNPIHYALFLSFFPQLVAGPIERSANMLPQIKEKHGFNVERIRRGILTIAYGLFIKIVLADNIGLLVDPVFADVDGHSGMELLMAVLMFAFEIYCDFAGYTRMAIGSAEVLGFRLCENFRQPYLASSVNDFWKRWHISLTSWFRDYLYIPLGGNRKGKARKYINTIIVFLFSGLWHGAAWHFVAWGGLNGLLCILEDVLRVPLQKCRIRLCGCTGEASNETLGWKILKRVWMFLAVDLTWLFFRAESIEDAWRILCKIASGFQMKWFAAADYAVLFPSVKIMMVVVISMLVLLLADTAAYLGKDLREIILKQGIVFRWIFYWITVMVIFFWGVYGTAYHATQFIYFQF